MGKFIDNGGPAFPRPVSEDTTQGTQHDGNRTVDPQDGMSMRDWFAGQMLAAMFGSETIQGQLEQAIRDGKITTPEEDRRRLAREIIAARCYAQADAMLEARKKNGGGS